MYISFPHLYTILIFLENENKTFVLGMLLFISKSEEKSILELNVTLISPANVNVKTYFLLLGKMLW
jgi:hypothetical protein